jgi:precorrin isomerase
MSDPQRRIRFDGTINLGHVLTMVTFIAAGAVGWNAMDKRITVLEEARMVQQQIDKRQDEDRGEMKKTVREDMKEIIRKVDILVERRN